MNEIIKLHQVWLNSTIVRIINFISRMKQPSFFFPLSINNTASNDIRRLDDIVINTDRQLGPSLDLRWLHVNCHSRGYVSKAIFCLFFSLQKAIKGKFSSRHLYSKRNDAKINLSLEVKEIHFFCYLCKCTLATKTPTYKCWAAAACGGLGGNWDALPIPLTFKCVIMIFDSFLPRLLPSFLNNRSEKKRKGKGRPFLKKNRKWIG